MWARDLENKCEHYFTSLTLFQNLKYKFLSEDFKTIRFLDSYLIVQAFPIFPY